MAIKQTMNIQRLVSSQTSYQKYIKKTLDSIRGESNKETVLRNIVLFCKQVFSSNANQRKKYLCLLFIKDIFENANSEYFQKLVDQSLARKLGNVVQNYVDNKGQEGKAAYEDRETAEKIYRFALETVVFWAKRLSLVGDSTFSQVYEELKKSKVPLPQEFMFYKQQMLINLWSNEGEKSQSSVHGGSPVIEELGCKFRQCKEELEQTISQSILNDEQVLTRRIIDKFREFLLFFFTNYKSLEAEETTERDTVIVYFHIINTFHKRICNRIYVLVQEIVNTIKQVFETTYPTEYDSVDRMDIIELAGVFKYNALTIFQRIHQRIEKEDALLGPFKLSLNFEHSQNQKYGSLEGSRLGSNSLIGISPGNNKPKHK